MQLHDSCQRDFDIYDRVKKLGIDLKLQDQVISTPNGRRICSVTFTPSGLVFTSGMGGGRGPVTNDNGDVAAGTEVGREARENHIRSLHWGLEPFGTLNDI